jgi:selenocysteine lyase/cysteine desulfurase
MLAARTGAVLRFAQLREDKQSLDVDHFRSLLSPRTMIVASVHVSNTLGCVNPVREMFEYAHASTPAVCVLDACQSLPHLPVDVQDLGCDFLAASSHKVLSRSAAPQQANAAHTRTDVRADRHRCALWETSLARYDSTRCGWRGND